MPTMYMRKLDTLFYGVDGTPYPRDDDYPIFVNDYVFTTRNYKLAKTFSFIVDHYKTKDLEVLECTDPYEDSYGEEIEYGIIFSCTKQTRLQLEYILRSGMGYAFLRSNKLLDGKVQGYSIEKWE